MHRAPAQAAQNGTIRPRRNFAGYQVELSSPPCTRGPRWYALAGCGRSVRPRHRGRRGQLPRSAVRRRTRVPWTPSDRRGAHGGNRGSHRAHVPPPRRPPCSRPLPSDWLLRHPSEGALVVLVDGDLVWNADADQFDEAATTALSPSAQRLFTTRPLWLDVRWGCLGEPPQPARGQPGSRPSGGRRLPEQAGNPSTRCPPQSSPRRRHPCAPR